MRRSPKAIRLVAAALLVLTGLVAQLLVTAGGAEPRSRVFMVHIDDVISPGSAGLLKHAIATAEAADATALVVRLDTPGGLLTSTRDMVSAIAESRVPVVGYIGPSGASATSAGAFILLSTHVAVMNSGTHVGASSPVAGDGSDIEGTMGKKVMNDSRALMRSIANSRGRNAAVAEQFVSEALSLTAMEAAENNVIDLVVEDSAQLLGAIDGRRVTVKGETFALATQGAELQEIKPRLLDRVLGYIAHPPIAHMLLSLGFLAIYVEILSPGLALPGVFGAIALVLGLVGMNTLPVNVGFLLLVGLGVALMVAEYFVAGFGVLGIGGAVAFVIGSLNLFDTPLPKEQTNSMLAVSIGVSAAVLLSSFLIGRSLARTSPGSTSLMGRRGEAMMSFHTQGFVLVDDKRWPADTDESLNHGDRIEVTHVTDEGRLTVKKVH